MRTALIFICMLAAGSCGAKPVPLPYHQALGRYEGTDGTYTARIIISNYTASVFDGFCSRLCVASTSGKASCRMRLHSGGNGAALSLSRLCFFHMGRTKLSRGCRDVQPGARDGPC